MNKKIISGVVIVCISLALFVIIDICRFYDGKKPVFTYKTCTLNDGGTKFYYGIGYQLIEWHRIDDAEMYETVYLVGKEVHILFGMIPRNAEPSVKIERMEKNEEGEIYALDYNGNLCYFRKDGKIERFDYENSDRRDVLTIILKESQAYFDGSKTVKETEDIIQSRVKLYLSEKI